MKHLLSFKLFEEGAAGVAAAVGGGGMGAVSTSSPSSTPGDAAGATIGSGDIGSAWGSWHPAVQRKHSNELKSSKRKKHKKRKRKTTKHKRKYTKRKK